MQCRSCCSHQTFSAARSLALLLAIIHTATGQIRILQPPQLAQQFPMRGVLKGSTAAFGTPYWGEQLIGRLEYNVSKGNEYCSDEDYDLVPLEDITEPIHTASPDERSNINLDNFHHWPRIVVVRRGKCHFAEKVKVAQDSKGASAVLIVDEGGSTRTPNDIRSIIMADDGLGSKIRIPSILISNKEGQQLIDVLLTGQSVIVELLWDLPNESIVTLDHWLSPSLTTSLQFLQSFAPYARTLNYRMNFRPHFFLFSLPADANSMCLDASAKFCSMSPDWRNSNATGREVVQEILRQSCVWFTTKSVSLKESDSGEYSEDWWNYMEKVGDRCLHPVDPASVYYGKPFSPDCSYELMRDLKIDPTKTQSCIETLGTAELATHLYNHAWSPTAMMINDARFAGPLDPFVVARAVCTGFTLSSEPQACTELKSHQIHDVLFHNVNLDPYIFGESLSYHKGGVAWWVYGLSVIVALIGCGMVVVAYRVWLLKQLRTELRYEVFEEVKSQLTEKIQTQHQETPSLLSHHGAAPHPSLSTVEIPINYSRYTPSA